MYKSQITKHLAENNIPESWIVELKANHVELLAPESDSNAYYVSDVSEAMSQVLFGTGARMTTTGCGSLVIEFGYAARLSAQAQRSNLIDQFGGEGYENLPSDEAYGSSTFYFWNGTDELYTTDADEFLGWVIG